MNVPEFQGVAGYDTRFNELKRTMIAKVGGLLSGQSFCIGPR